MTRFAAGYGGGCRAGAATVWVLLPAVGLLLAAAFLYSGPTLSLRVASTCTACNAEECARVLEGSPGGGGGGVGPAPCPAAALPAAASASGPGGKEAAAVRARLWEYSSAIGPRELQRGLFSRGEAALLRRFTAKLIAGGGAGGVGVGERHVCGGGRETCVRKVAGGDVGWGFGGVGGVLSGGGGLPLPLKNQADRRWGWGRGVDLWASTQMCRPAGMWVGGGRRQAASR